MIRVGCFRGGREGLNLLDRRWGGVVACREWRAFDFLSRGGACHFYYV